MQKAMETTTVNRIFWGLLILAATGLSVYVAIALAQRQLSPIQDQVKLLNQNLANQSAEFAKLKATDFATSVQTQVENLTGQLKGLAETVQAQQKELENFKNQMQQAAGTSQIFTKRLESLETMNANLQSSVDELETNIFNVTKEFEQRQQALESLLGPVLVVDNPMPYNSTCPEGYATLEITFFVWSANTELDRLHDLNRDRLICKPAQGVPMLPSLSQTMGVSSLKEDRMGSGGLSIEV